MKIYTIRFNWFTKTFVKGRCRQPFRKAVPFILPKEACARAGFPEPLLAPGIHGEDVTLGWVKGLGFKQTKSRDTVNTPNTLPLHCTSSFSQSLFLIKASQKPCELWADTLTTFYALSFLRVSYIFKEAFDWLSQREKWNLHVLYIIL